MNIKNILLSLSLMCIGNVTFTAAEHTFPSATTRNKEVREMLSGYIKGADNDVGALLQKHPHLRSHLARERKQLAQKLASRLEANLLARSEKLTEQAAERLLKKTLTKEFSPAEQALLKTRLLNRKRQKPAGVCFSFFFV